MNYEKKKYFTSYVVYYVNLCNFLQSKAQLVLVRI